MDADTGATLKKDKAGAISYEREQALLPEYPRDTAIVLLYEDMFAPAPTSLPEKRPEGHADGVASGCNWIAALVHRGQFCLFHRRTNNGGLI